MMIAKFGLVAIKHLCGTHMLSKLSSIKVETRLMKHDSINKRLRTRRSSAKKCVPKYLCVASADPSRAPAAVQGHAAPHFPRQLNAAIENWRMLQPGRPRLAQPRSWS
jgi:hypothetical protein